MEHVPTVRYISETVHPPQVTVSWIVSQDPDTNRPLEDVIIEDCGELKPGEDDGVPPPADGDEIPAYPGSTCSSWFACFSSSPLSLSSVFGWSYLFLCMWSFLSEDSGLDFTKVDEILAKLEVTKAAGNKLFSEEKFKEAIDKYEKVLR